MKLLSFTLSILLLFSTNLCAFELDLEDSAYEASFNERGTASWYGPGFHGRITANGERYNQFGLTAAHKSIRFGTVLHITNLANDETVLVQVNDRGPYIGERIIDLSEAAMERLDGMKSGVINIHAVGVSDTDGIPLDPSLAYFINCALVDSEEAALEELEKVHSIGIFELNIFQLEDSFLVGVGPFDDFQVAQDKMIELVSIYPEIIIELFPKNIGL